MESVILFFLTRMLSCKEGLQSPVSYTYAGKASPGEGRYYFICFLPTFASIQGFHLHSGHELSSGLSWHDWQNMCPSGHWNT